MNINGYTLKSELKNANSGFSKWGFATKNGKEYFIKELINPVYPIDKSIMTEEMFQQRRIQCSQYEEKFKNYFGAINRASRGNLVRIIEFFRYGSRYYLISEKVNAESFSMEYIASLEEEKKLLLMKSVAYCFYDLHSVGIVHSDIKPNNILITATPRGNYVARLIDFDSGFMKGDNIGNKELGGELVYLAPETFLGIYGEDVQVDEKADIFGLGLMFYEYYCGYLPYYDHNEYAYPYEVVLDGGQLILDREVMPEDVAELIESMLNVDPQKRPSAEDIIRKLDKISDKIETTPVIKKITISYDGAFGKFISLTPDAIEYKNTVHPCVREEMESNIKYYPSDYLTPRKLTMEERNTYDSIIERIIEAGLWELVKVSEDTPCVSDKILQEIKVICEDGKIYSYSTEGVLDPSFSRIVSILSGYCPFPVKYISINSSDDEGGKKGHHVIADNSTEKSKRSDWFSRAGDL